MKEMITHSLESVRKRLKTGKNCCFELFGYDFIIDADLGLWLIEVNTNPCLEESSKLLERYLPRMVNDMLKLTVD
jgi:tubulin--tyrosine ligase/tubulin polyglutamylase TTLL9